MRVPYKNLLTWRDIINGRWSGSYPEGCRFKSCSRNFSKRIVAMLDFQNLCHNRLRLEDTGSKHVGVAVVGNDKVLYQSQTELRDDIKKKMDRRRAFRKSRRFRKTRYRKCRF